MPAPSRLLLMGIASVLFCAIAPAFAQVGPTGAPPLPPAPPAGSEAPLTRLPALKHNDPPDYPHDEACLKIGGTTMLVFSLDASGRPDHVAIEQSSRNRSLDRAALVAGREWEFEPGMRDSVAVPTKVRVPVRFVAPDLPPPYCPRVEGVELGRTSDSDAVGQTRFSPSDPLHAIVSHAIEGRAVVTARWTYIANGVAHELASQMQTLDGGSPSPIDFHLDPPAEGWTPADYTVEIRVDGVAAAERPFGIVAPAADVIPGDPARR